MYWDFFLELVKSGGGIIRYGAKLFYVYVEVMVFKLIVIICKVYGGVYDVMFFKYIRGDYNIVWLIVWFVVMGVDGVV